MNKNLKKLAALFAKERKVSRQISEELLKLPKSDLKVFLRFYKSFINDKKVVVTSAIKLPDSTLSTLKKQYKNFDIISNIDRNIGGGLKIVHKDTIVDSSVQSHINSLINSLKV